ASNYWSANKMRDANAALVNGPQFGWSVPSYVYGVGLHGGDFNVVGNTLLALPALLFAHNTHVGWGSTAGLSDQVDVFAERLNPEDADQYWHKGAYQPFESWQETINVRDAKPVTVTARRSVHGMVQSLDQKNNLAYTRARAWEGGELKTLMAWVNLAKDKTLDAVQQRVADVTTNINFYYMDRDGNLGYTHGGRYPRRAAGQDSRLPTPGDGELDWQGYRPPGENPTVRNPPQHYIANWNNRPSVDWISIDLWSYTWSRADRATLIFNEIEAKPELSVQELWDINRRVSFDDVTAPFLLPYLFAAWQDQEQPAAVASALTALQSWNNEWIVDDDGDYGPAPTLMDTWLSGLLENVFKDDIGKKFFHLYAATNNPNNQLGASMGTGPGTKAMIRNLDQLSADGAVSDYDFFNGKDYQATLRDTFTRALKALQAEQGDDMQQWRIAAHPMQWQAFNFRGVPQALERAAQELPAYMNRGSENNLFIAQEGTIKAYDVIPPGQSGHIGADKKVSPHYADQMQMFSSFEYKPVPFDRADIEKAAASVKELNYSR
ncbi:MAG: penicillin acylase family protein, partial [Pseudomonadales bacterium]